VSGKNDRKLSVGEMMVWACTYSRCRSLKGEVDESVQEACAAVYLLRRLGAGSLAALDEEDRIMLADMLGK